MAKGRPHTPTAILKKRGSWHANHREHEPQPPEGLPECPEELNPIARAEWDYYLPILDEMGVVSPAELGYLVEMCRQLAICTVCHIFIDKAMKVGDPRLLMVPGGTGPRESPIMILERKAWGVAEPIMAKFGLNPRDRAGMRAPERPAKDAAAQLMKKALEGGK